ncbi:MAG: hypothetical protein SFU86_07470 [Pirellulaceae bacterium]|nr:hypothetical protein [Pirellulaceae bacterium]
MIATDVIEIEIDGPRNENCVFRPLQQRIRGRFDLRRVAEPLAMMKLQQHPDPIPGQRLRLDLATAKAELIEPLRLPEFEALRARYERDPAGVRQAELPKDEVYENVDVATWLYWLSLEVAAGKARLIRGRFPTPLPGKPKRHFYSAEPPKREEAIADALNNLAEATKANTAVMTELLKRVAK